MRLFLTFQNDPAFRKTMGTFLQKGRKALPRLRWFPPERVHLTLKFIGEAVLSDLRQPLDRLRLAAANLSPFNTTIREHGLFGPRNRRILWLGASGTERLAETAGLVRGLFRPWGDEKPFTPHFTVARAKRPFDEKLFRQLSLPPLKYRVRGIELVQSELRPEGPVYTVLRLFPFEGEQ